MRSLICCSAIRQPLLFSLLSGLILLATGCSNVDGDNGVQQSAATAIALPDFFKRAIDRDLLSVTVMFDGVVQPVVANADKTEWRGNFSLPTDRPVALQIEWRHAGLLLARFNQTVGPVAATTVLVVQPEDYQTTGSEFDSDGDGVSNLAQLQSSVSEPEVDVIIPRVSAEGAPGINGTSGIVWANNPLLDTSGQVLAIDNLMVDAGADRADGNTEFYWQALHDGQYLYLIVYAERLAIATSHADSAAAVNDDTLQLFLDGDNSKGQAYDGVDDRHFRIPLLKQLKPVDASGRAIPVFDDNNNLVRDSEGNIQVVLNGDTVFLPAGEFESNRRGDPDGRFERGSNSAPLPEDMTFANCSCTQEQQIYEIKINLQQVGINLDQPFGIELQLDNDIDGGNRDARYGWKHPSRSGTGAADNTWFNPSYMGTARLAP